MMPNLSIDSAPTTRRPDLLAYYEALELTSRDMLAAARGGHWDRVAELEGAACGLIVELRLRLRHDALDAGQTRTKLRILRRIVQNDAEMRCLAQPWLRDLHLGEPGTRRLH